MSGCDLSSRDGVSPEDLAKELQMDANLHELAGVVPTAALAARIRDGVTQGEPTPGHRARRYWVTAAGLVIGIGVVATVALLRTEEQYTAAVQPQGPTRAGDSGAAKPEKPVPSLPAQFVTVIADYSDNRIVEVDPNGMVLWQVDDVIGACDAERLANGNYLLTEFSMSRVREVDRTGRTVWEYGNLRSPYDADRLENGNTLIADTFSRRVIEVNPKKEIVWELRVVVDREGKKTAICPFDVDRVTGSGTTLIADRLEGRVVEVAAKGEIVWEARALPNAHDADRLPNGNTLVALRSPDRVVEIDTANKVVWELRGVDCPSDADRLPNGNTLVAEKTLVREFDKDGKEVWRHPVTLAMEANRYPR